MGTWGTGISSNDTYADVYADFFAFYNEGKEVDEVTQLVLAQNQELLQMPDAVNDLWFALAKAQWECKALELEVFAKVKNIVESGDDLKVWSELGASKSDLAKREKVLERFLQLLQSERPKAKKRKKKVIRTPIFKKGDCLTYKLADNKYGGAVILEAEYETELGQNLVAVTRINQVKKPSVKEFEKAEVLIKNFGKWDGTPEIVWICNHKPKEVIDLVEVIGSLKIEREFVSRDEKYKYFFTSGWKSALVEIPCLQFQSEKTKARPAETLTVDKLIKKSFWERLTSFL
jgi:hypothetical protein